MHNINSTSVIEDVYLLLHFRFWHFQEWHFQKQNILLGSCSGPPKKARVGSGFGSPKTPQPYYLDHFNTFEENFDFDTFKNDTFESVWVEMSIQK